VPRAALLRPLQRPRGHCWERRAVAAPVALCVGTLPSHQHLTHVKGPRSLLPSLHLSHHRLRLYPWPNLRWGGDRLQTSSTRTRTRNRYTAEYRLALTLCWPWTRRRPNGQAPGMLNTRHKTLRPRPRPPSSLCGVPVLASLQHPNSNSDDTTQLIDSHRPRARFPTRILRSPPAPNQRHSGRQLGRHHHVPPLLKESEIERSNF
jgi:hypothetical protein